MRFILFCAVIVAALVGFAATSELRMPKSSELASDQRQEDDDWEIFSA